MSSIEPVTTAEAIRAKVREMRADPVARDGRRYCEHCGNRLDPEMYLEGDELAEYLAARRERELASDARLFARQARYEAARNG